MCFGPTGMEEKPPTYENGQDIRDRAFEFACRVVRFGQKVYEGGGVGRMLVPQLVNSATSFDAMLEEARAAESKRDFISKCCIGLKEAREAHVRLKVMEVCRIGPTSEATALRQEAYELVSIVGAIIRNTRRNAGVTKQARPRRRIPDSIPGSRSRATNS